MKILYVSPHLSTGGLPQFLLKKIQVLIDEADVYCVEYANHGGFVVQREQIKNLLKNKFIELGENKFDLLAVIKELAPDVVHFEEMPEYFMDMALAQKIYAKERKYLIFETSHDSSFDASTKKVFPDKFTFVSEFQKRNVEALGIPSEVHEYPIVLKTKPQRNEALKILGLDPNKKHVVNVGLFTPRKNQAEIIEYAKKLKDYPIQFHFIGNQADNFRFYWEPLMKDFPSNCTWWNERKDVENFYQAADLFLFTSRGTANNKETSPLVIREAVSFNLPSLIYDLPVYLDMYDKYQNVEYLNFDDLEENCTKILKKLKIDSRKPIEILSKEINDFNNGNTFKVAKKNSDIAFVISSYPKSSESKKTTKACVEELKKFNVPIIVTSHCGLPVDIQDACDYAVIDKPRNILTKQSYYVRFWQTFFKNGENNKCTLHLDTSLNDIYHGPAVYTNYYNGISLAEKLGFKKVICLNFDFILNDKKFFNKIYNILLKSSGYFVRSSAPEGEVLKTAFHAIDVDLFFKAFPKIENEQDYENWWRNIKSESNGLENIYFHCLKDYLASCYVCSEEEFGNDISLCDIDLNSQVEYFTILPIKHLQDKICLTFRSSHKIDSRFIKIHYPNGVFEQQIKTQTLITEFIDKPSQPCQITAEIFDLTNLNTPIYKKTILVDKDYLDIQLNKNGIVEKI